MIYTKCDEIASSATRYSADLIGWAGGSNAGVSPG